MPLRDEAAVVGRAYSLARKSPGLRVEQAIRAMLSDAFCYSLLILSGITQQPRLLTVHQVARRLRLSEVTVRRKIASGELPSVQLGGRYAPLRVDEDELRAWLSEHARAARLPAGAPSNGQRLAYGGGNGAA